MDLKLNFTTDLQMEFIKFVIKDKKKGLVMLKLLNDSYFSLIEDGFIFRAIETFYNKEGTIPSKPLLKDHIDKLSKTIEFKNILSTDDIDLIDEKVDKIYKSKELSDPEILMDRAEKFAQYVELIDVIENTDIQDPDNFERFVRKAQKAVESKVDILSRGGTFLIKNLKKRQLDRQINESIIRTPFRQINETTNAGGYPRNNVIVVLDKPKHFKSGMLVNLGIGYMKHKKKVIMFDLENGEDSLAMRYEQSINNIDKRTLLSGEEDKKIHSTLRRFKTIGGEVYIKRFPAYSSTLNFQEEIDYIYREYGIQFDVALVDYPGLMSPTKGQSDSDTSNLGNVYLDIANLAVKNDFDAIWCAHHVKRDALPRESSKWLETDVAKSSEIGRHVNAIWGLNTNDDEKEQGILRMELVVQRDGKPSGRCIMSIDFSTQRTVELNREQRKAYDETFYSEYIEQGGKKLTPMKNVGSDLDED